MRARNIVFILALGSFVVGSQREARADNIINMTNQGMSAWLINGGNPNGTLTLARGQTYQFVVNALPNHPFWITSVPGLTPLTPLSDPGLSGNGTDSGTVTFTPSASTPSTVSYQCGNHTAMTGTINIVAANAVPAVGTFPLLAFGLLLGAAGLVAVRRRRRL
jgi:hypothetical protein